MKEEAKAHVLNEIRKDHEPVAREIVSLLRKLGEACAREKELQQAVMSVTGGYSTSKYKTT